MAVPPYAQLSRKVGALGTSLCRAAVGRGHFPLVTFTVSGQAVPLMPTVPDSNSWGCCFCNGNFAFNVSVWSFSKMEKMRRDRDKGERLSKGCSSLKAGKT